MDKIHTLREYVLMNDIHYSCILRKFHNMALSLLLTLIIISSTIQVFLHRYPFSPSLAKRTIEEEEPKTISTLCQAWLIIHMLSSDLLMPMVVKILV